MEEGQNAHETDNELGVEELRTHDSPVPVMRQSGRVTKPPRWLDDYYTTNLCKAT